MLTKGGFRMMYQKISLNHLGFLTREIEKLKKISNRLHRYHEISCNYGLTSRQEKTENRLKENAQAIAQDLGYNAYIQGDPRGCALYLIPQQWTKEYAESHYYPDGMPIY